MEKKSNHTITTEMIIASTTQTRGSNETPHHFLRRLTHLKLAGTVRRKVNKIENISTCRNLKVNI